MIIKVKHEHDWYKMILYLFLRGLFKGDGRPTAQTRRRNNPTQQPGPHTHTGIVIDTGKHSDGSFGSSNVVINEAKFGIDKDILTGIHWPLANYTELSDDDVETFVFVTAANLPYLPVAQDAIATIQQHFPTRKIIFYDLEDYSGDGWRKTVSVSLQSSPNPPLFPLFRYFCPLIYHFLDTFVR